eukprot:m.66803 g.66803  ORF g.66803 m.66803 type:complete len:193 (+) comp35409_c0_seq17:252-830(+)
MIASGQLNPARISLLKKLPKNRHHQNSSVLASGMTDAQRDQIDLEAQEYMSTCGALISKLKTQMTKESGPGVRRQQVEHRQGVVSVLSRYLKDVCTIYSRQRAVRVKRILDKKRLARLVPDSAPLDFKTLKATQNSTVEHQSNNDGLTPEEKEMFEQENAQLLEELTTTVDEVRWGDLCGVRLHGDDKDLLP